MALDSDDGKKFADTLRVYESAESSEEFLTELLRDATISQVIRLLDGLIGDLKDREEEEIISSKKCECGGDLSKIGSDSLSVLLQCVDDNCNKQYTLDYGMGSDERLSLIEGSFRRYRKWLLW